MKCGLVISPFENDIGIEKNSQYYIRNEEMVKLSDVIVFVSLEKKSGTMNTYKINKKYDKQVYVVDPEKVFPNNGNIFILKDNKYSIKVNFLT